MASASSDEDEDDDALMSGSGIDITGAMSNIGAMGIERRNPGRGEGAGAGAAFEQGQGSGGGVNDGAFGSHLENNVYSAMGPADGGYWMH
jgi:hypothetical protein